MDEVSAVSWSRAKQKDKDKVEAWKRAREFCHQPSQNLYIGPAALLISWRSLLILLVVVLVANT